MKLRLDQIQRDEKLSPRIEKGTVAEIAKGYAECFDQLPPIVVFKVPDRNKYILVDGWHRYRAAEILELEEIETIKRVGSLEEAKEYALLANLKHGLPLTRKEKRRVITEFLKLHPERSNRWIAEDLGTTDGTVDKIRKKLEEKPGAEFPHLNVLIGKDGKEYPRTPYIAEETKGQAEEEAETEEAEEEKVEEAETEEIQPAMSIIGLYQLNKVYQVDCIEGLTGLPEESLDLVFADPPYNLGKKYGEGFKDKQKEGEYFAWCMKWFIATYRALKTGGAFYLMHYPEVAAHWKQQLDNIFTFRRWIAWIYPSNVGHSKGNNWRRSHRVILYYVKGATPIYFKGEADPQPYRNPSDIRIKHLGKEGTTPYDWWECNLVKNVSKDKTSWPNQLPLDLLMRIVLSSCSEDGVVCDPFIGSGTTAEAAVRMGRNWIGFDTQSKACQFTEKRIERIAYEPGN